MRNMPQINGTKDVVAYVTGNLQDRKIIPGDRIARSWERSLLKHGLDPKIPQPVDILTHYEIQEQLQLHEDYLNIARNGLTGLSKRIANAGFSVLLTDEFGLTLDARLPKMFKDTCQEAGLLVGSTWKESQAGTNGIGTCLEEKESMIIHHHEHFFANHSALSCSVTPIFDPLGNLKGCLNASCLNVSGSKENQFLTLQMIIMYGRMIENSYFRQTYRSQITMNVKETNNFSDLAQEQLLAINERGVIIGANRSAFAEYESLLDRGQQLLGTQIEDIVGLNVDQLLTQSNGGASTIRQQSPKLLDEIEIAIRVPANRAMRNNQENTIAKQKDIASPSVKHKHPTLEKLAGEDEEVLRNVQQIRHIINKDIPILITGETGTGKEAFARAIHDASNKKNGPFIALNCAAIPESLIESELFGYKSGSFTGANRKGMKGKLEQANEGTIFLDEIGDMPAQLQTRLLRALAEREIMPLGATAPIPLDIQVISATHQDLMQRIKEKMFREDFYYRLNGMSLKLPSLRERNDKDFIINCILDSELGGADGVAFAPQARQILHDYHWPGNIRQLANVLRYALAVSKDKHITVDDLPIEVRASKEIYKEEEIIPEAEKSMSLSDFVSDEEGRRLIDALRQYRWNITQVSEELNICRSTVYRKMKKYNIVQPNDIY
ncbi:sigma-54-dependent Fis family transcriptional regulator [Neptuniibacter marinus]|uniref:sigma-54-dependent Fis family transcriptional regulator n=1 Tax=Neptuniibacter marinus TaxID=1806670 RepID=UPI00082F3755|nr:sigma-54-dependent Fis family transcriptional regulator [Neptuniibacter marinus]